MYKVAHGELINIYRDEECKHIIGEMSSNEAPIMGILISTAKKHLLKISRNFVSHYRSNMSMLLPRLKKIYDTLTKICEKEKTQWANRFISEANFSRKKDNVHKIHHFSL